MPFAARCGSRGARWGKSIGEVVSEKLPSRDKKDEWTYAPISEEARFVPSIFRPRDIGTKAPRLNRIGGASTGAANEAPSDTLSICVRRYRQLPSCRPSPRRFCSRAVAFTAPAVVPPLLSPPLDPRPAAQAAITSLRASRVHRGF